MYEIEPPNPHPRPPNRAQKATRLRQSSRREAKQTAIAARAPGIQAPDSWPKSPRIPQPIESESATSSRDTGLYNGFAGMVECLSNEGGDRLATPGRSQRSIND